MRARAAALAVLIAGCDQALEVSLIAAPGEGDDADLGCVNLVQVDVQGNAPDDFQTVCLSVEPGTIRSLADHGLEGALEVPMPESGLRFLRVVGVASPFGVCEAGDPIFHGAAEYHGGTSMPIPLRMSLDCAKAAPTTASVRVIDQAALIETGQCTAAAETWMASAGMIVPTDLDLPSLLPAAYYQAFAGTGETAVAAGAAPVSLAYSGAEGSSCLALAVIRPDRNAGNVACAIPGPRTACAGAGEIELAQADFDNMMALLDTSPDLRNTTLVTLWDAELARPIAGATATAADQRAGIEMVGLTGGVFARTPGAATGASGSFLVHSLEPTVVSISAPGYRARDVEIGSYIVGGAIVVLSR
jgi:hypothetical protein